MLRLEASGSNDKRASFSAIFLFDEKSKFHQQVSSCSIDAIKVGTNGWGKNTQFVLMRSRPTRTCPVAALCRNLVSGAPEVRLAVELWSFPAPKSLSPWALASC